MLQQDVKHLWMFVAILFFRLFVRNDTCERLDTHGQKNVLFVSIQNHHFPSEAVYYKTNGHKVCFRVLENKVQDCFNCSFTMRGHENNYSLILDKETLYKQDVVLVSVLDHKCECMPSGVYNTNSGFLSYIHKCLGNNTIRLSHFCGKSPPYDEDACKGLAETDYKFTVLNEKRHCVSCKPPGKKPAVSITIRPPESNTGTGISLERATNIMNNLSSVLEELGNASTATITSGRVKGVITKLLLENQNSLLVGITTRNVFRILEDNYSEMNLSVLVQIPAEASNMAAKRNGSFAAVVLFPGMRQDEPNSHFLNNKVLGIEMGAEISNLSDTVDIQYRNVDKNGSIASCRSWDGKGKEAIWTTDGCQTSETNDSITCQCSHLTFFAILLSPPPGNISSSDFKALTYITSVGCGLSLFFLTVALFMHCLIRKRESSNATKILINLFVAMFILNLSFLVNESLARLGNYGTCVAVAAVMHYAMLASFTWFFMEALHLYLSLRKLPADIKHYMVKICVTGWVTPAVVVITLLASRQYDYMGINTDDGNSAKMCWISDAAVHQGVNLGYYAVVFIFTVVIFVMTVWQSVFPKPKAKEAPNRLIKANSFSVFSLFLLLGITWAFAFFSHGPLLISSYYIFTILNSFQGFFLFLYYYNSSKPVREDRSTSVSTSSTSHH